MLLSKTWKRQSQSQERSLGGGGGGGALTLMNNANNNNNNGPNSSLSLSSSNNNEKDRKSRLCGIASIVAFIRRNILLLLMNNNDSSIMRGLAFFISGFIVCLIIIKPPPKLLSRFTTTKRSNNIDYYQNYILYQQRLSSQSSSKHKRKKKKEIHKLGGKDTKGINNMFPFTESSNSNSQSNIKYDQHLNYEYCQQITPSWIWNLHRYENQIFSQSGEDGITQQLVNHLLLSPSSSYHDDTTSPAHDAEPNNNNNKKFYYVEFGTEDGSQCNTRILREVYKWPNGLLMDGSNYNPSINLYKEMITPNNIIELFEKYNVPTELDYLSEDTDYADYYIWKSILESESESSSGGGKKYKPKIVVSEINPNFLPNESATVHSPAPSKDGNNNLRFWKDNNNYFGLSALALKRIWNKNNYIMVYCNFNQINCYGIRNDLLLKQLDENDDDDDNNNNNEDLSAAASKQQEQQQQQKNAKKSNNQLLDDIQECLWRKPMAYHRKLHKLDVTKEKYCWVNENGDIEEEDQDKCNYIPSFMMNVDDDDEFIPWQKKSDPTFS